MTCHLIQHHLPIQNSLWFWKYWLNCSYFVKIMTRKPKIGYLTNMIELYPFLESKKWYILFKWILWSNRALRNSVGTTDEVATRDRQTSTNNNNNNNNNLDLPFHCHASLSKVNIKFAKHELCSATTRSPSRESTELRALIWEVPTFKFQWTVCTGFRSFLGWDKFTFGNERG